MSNKFFLIASKELIKTSMETNECTDKCYEIFFLFSFDCSGFVAEHMDLRHFLTIGMLSSGLFTVLFGMGYFWKLHYFAYFVTIQVYTMICLYICTYKIDSNPTFIYIYIYIFFFPNTVWLKGKIEFTKNSFFLLLSETPQWL